MREEILSCVVFVLLFNSKGNCSIVIATVLTYGTHSSCLPVVSSSSQLLSVLSQSRNLKDWNGMPEHAYTYNTHARWCIIANGTAALQIFLDLYTEIGLVDNC